MSAVSLTGNVTNDSDAHFRAWGKQISDQLLAFGIVRTSDTGQIDWTTVTVPSGSTAGGYEIFRFNDALQSTAPVFFKLEYGSGPSTGYPSLWLTVGSGSDGSGNLTGVTTVRRQFYIQNVPAPFPLHFSGDTGRFSFMLQASSYSYGWGISMERSKDSAGADTAEAVLINAFNTSSFSHIAWDCITGPCSAWETSPSALGPSVAPFGVAGSQVAIYPIFHNKGVFFNPGLNWLCYVEATIGQATVISFDMYGVSHDFIALGTASYNPIARVGVTTALLMRYD